MRRIATALALLFAACSFPDVTYSSDGSAKDGAEILDGDVDASVVDSSMDQSMVDVPPAMMDVVGIDVDPACDGDGDTFFAPGGKCGGLDCDDGDARANPGIKAFQTFAPTMKTNGDWNCDGNPEKQFKTNIACNALNLACDSGFTGAPACGATGQFVQCAVNVTCQQVSTSMKVQGCR